MYIRSKNTNISDNLFKTLEKNRVHLLLLKNRIQEAYKDLYTCNQDICDVYNEDCLDDLLSSVESLISTIDDVNNQEPSDLAMKAAFGTKWHDWL